MTKREISVPMVFDWIGFGSACLACRTEAKLTLYQVGQLCDISGAAVADIENATHRNAYMSTVLAVANVYDLDVRAYFMLGDTRLKSRMLAKRVK